MAQKPQLLKASDFLNEEINSEWVYIKFKYGSDPDLTKFPGSKPLFKTKPSNNSNGIMKVKVPKGMTSLDYCNELRSKNPDIQYADPILTYVPLADPSDALISNQFYLDNIRAFDAWDITKGDDDITIGIIDSGIDLDHEDIETNLWINIDDPVDGIDNDNNGYIDDYYGYDFADEDTDPSIQNGNHGMIVAGIAGASTNNDVGIAGVGYNTKVAALKGFKSSTGVSGGLYDAILYAAENGFEVVNLSWGRMGSPLQSEQDIINYVVLEKNMIAVAAAGNEGGKSTEENRWYPASYDNVLSVGASDAADNKSSGSTFNHAVDLIAPGVSMYSTVNGNGYSNGGPGTSFASPLVAATAALVKDQFPSLTAVQIMERIRATADDVYDVGSNSIYDGKLGKGRLNALRAVSESNVRSLRAENPVLTSSFGEYVFFGDTVDFSVTVTNHLSPINAPLIAITSPENDFSISSGSFNPGFMNTHDTENISFSIILNDDIQPDTEVAIRLDYTASGYNDFQYLSVTTSPDYVDFGNDIVNLTISGDGDLGFNNYQPFEGGGFRHFNDTLIYYSGIVLTTNSSNVSDNIISNYSDLSRDQDFSIEQYYKLYNHPGADHFGYSEFTDLNKSILIEQSNISWDNEDFLIIRYRIVNNSLSALSNVSFGVFNDWDLDDATSNYAEYDIVNNYMFARNNSSSVFAGIKVKGGDNFEYSAIDMADFNGNSSDVNGVFSEFDKYNYLVTQDIATAGNEGDGNDVASISGITINQLDPFEEKFIDVIYAVSDSRTGLESVFTNANSQLDNFLLFPRVLETFSVCAGSSLTVDPAEGDTFEFYEDPLGQDLISIGSSFIPATITKDTTFYVKNLDNGYPSDIFALEVKLFNEIAEFSMSTDTLYLDNPTTNVVQFTDESLDAISWDWDFDQGTSSNIQNPSLSFSIPGTYTISLEVENSLGCIDSFTRDLVVANRPSSPTFSDVIICPNEDVILNDPSAESLNVYVLENNETPSLSGFNVTLESISHDTTVYVSGIYGSFESSRTAINIDVLEVNGTLSYRPDTTTTDHQIVLEANEIASGSSLIWRIDGEIEGSENKLSIPAEAGTINIQLEINSSDNCTKNIDSDVLISTSPFASQDDLFSCFEQQVKIRPQNGVYFGFYEDEELTTLIKKGTQLVTNSYSQIYVVNLDDGLPGMPIEVNITNSSAEFEIDHEISVVGEKNKVDLSINTEDEIDTQSWYINGILSETSEAPTFFLNNELYQIVLEVRTTSGCQNTDTLNLDFTPVLSINEKSKLEVYPNPTNGLVNIQSLEKIEEVWLFGMDGKEISNIQTPKSQINFTSVKPGLYILKVRINNIDYEAQLVIDDE